MLQAHSQSPQSNASASSPSRRTSLLPRPGDPEYAEFVHRIRTKRRQTLAHRFDRGMETATGVMTSQEVFAAAYVSALDNPGDQGPRAALAVLSARLYEMFLNSPSYCDGGRRIATCARSQSTRLGLSHSRERRPERHLHEDLMAWSRRVLGEGGDEVFHLIPVSFQRSTTRHYNAGSIGHLSQALDVLEKIGAIDARSYRTPGSDPTKVPGVRWPSADYREMAIRLTWSDAPTALIADPVAHVCQTPKPRYEGRGLSNVETWPMLLWLLAQSDVFVGLKSDIREAILGADFPAELTERCLDAPTYAGVFETWSSREFKELENRGYLQRDFVKSPELLAARGRSIRGSYDILTAEGYPKAFGGSQLRLRVTEEGRRYLAEECGHSPAAEAFARA